MFERYTEKARRIIFFGRYEASQFGSPYIETEHLLLGLLREDKALAHRFLESHSAIESIRKQIEAQTPVREYISTSVDLPLSHECKRVLTYGAEEAERLNHRHIGPEHLLLGLMREEKSLAAQILRERGLQVSAVREAVVRSSAESVDSLSNLEIAHDYINAIEKGARGEALAKFFDSEMTQEEFSILTSSDGSQRNLLSPLPLVEPGQKFPFSQSYIILHELVAGDHIALEILWEGTLADVLLSTMQTLQAHFAVFLEFRNGKILKQRNYDCFDPLPGK